MWKAAGARAALGGDLDAVVRAARKAIENTRSIGIGHHGEPGIKVDDLKPGREMARMMLDVVLPDLPFKKNDEVVALVSGLGATPVMELYILCDTIEELLAASGIRVYRPYVGNFFTSLDMMGVTVALMKVDNELKQLVDLEADCMGLT